MTEKGLWSWLRKARETLGQQLHVFRVENVVTSGMPDVEGHLKGRGQFWIELKVAKRPVHDTTKIRIKIRRAQVEWMARRWWVGGSVWLLVQVGDRYDRAVYMIPGSRVPVMLDGVTEEWLDRESVVKHNASAVDIIKVAAKG